MTINPNILELDIIGARGEDILQMVRRLGLGGCAADANDSEAAVAYATYISGLLGSGVVADAVAAADAAAASAAVAGSDLWTRPVKSIQTSPPGSPSTGDRYLVAHSGTSGGFVSHEDQAAEWNGSSWLYSGAPLAGQRVYVANIALDLVNSSGWKADGASIQGFVTIAGLLSGFPSGISVINGTTIICTGRTVAGDSGPWALRYDSTDTTSSDNGGTIRVDGGASRRWFAGSDYNAALFGAKGDAQQITDAVVTGTTVSSGSHTFVASDVGKVAIVYLAAASVSGGRNETLITTIASISSGHAVLTTGATNNIASNGVFAWGTDDTTAINAALAAAGPQAAVILDAPGYIMTDTFKIGNATATWAHNVRAASIIYFGIANHTVSCMERHAAKVNGAYIPMNLLGALTLDHMGTGLDGRVDMGGLNIFEENVRQVRSYRIGWYRHTTGTDYIQQLMSIAPTILDSGLHGICNNADSSVVGGGFIDKITNFGYEVVSYGENNGAFGVSGDQKGALIYSITPNSGANNTINGHVYIGAGELNSTLQSATAFGSSQNPNGIFFADGTQSNTLFGSNASAKNLYFRWLIDSPDIENSLGGTAATGAVFAAQTTGVNLVGCRFLNIPKNNAWTAMSSNIDFSSASGNELTIPNDDGGVSTRALGANLTIGDLISASLTTGQVLARTSNAANKPNIGGANSNVVAINATPAVIAPTTTMRAMFIIQDQTSGGMALVLWDHFASTPIAIGTNAASLNTLTNIAFTDTSAGLKAATTGGTTNRNLAIFSISPAS